MGPTAGPCGVRRNIDETRLNVLDGAPHTGCSAFYDGGTTRTLFLSRQGVVVAHIETTCGTSFSLRSGDRARMFIQSFTESRLLRRQLIFRHHHGSREVPCRVAVGVGALPVSKPNVAFVDPEAMSQSLNVHLCRVVACALPR